MPLLTSILPASRRGVRKRGSPAPSSGWGGVLVVVVVVVTGSW